MSHYDDVLQELRQKGHLLANQYIVELFNILRDEEKLPPQDCRSKIEHDCIDLWSKATIRKYLSPEAKDVKKQKAAKISNEVKKKKREVTLLAAQNSNGVGINLTEDNSVSQNEPESSTFQKELREKLSARVPTQEMYDTAKLLTAKDEEIEQLKIELEEAVKKGQWGNNTTIFLPSKFALEIYQSVSLNRSAGITSEFNLEHDGNRVTAVREVIK